VRHSLTGKVATIWNGRMCILPIYIYIIRTISDILTYLIWGKSVRRIGIEANEELRSIFKRDVHLILQVRVAKKRSA
jgi:hypothetical protein